MNDILKDFVDAFTEETGKTSGYDTEATVTRVDEEGTAWVHIPGGVDETPVQLTMSVEPGDVVNVRISGGRAWINGNRSRPPTDDAKANTAQETADTAQNTAVTAQESADAAQETADDAAAQAAETNNYFWHDTAGAHVSTVEGDADSGPNVLINSNSMQIRKGTKKLSEFTADGINLYQNDVLAAQFSKSRAKIGLSPGNFGNADRYATLCLSPEVYVEALKMADHYCPEPAHEIEEIIDESGQIVKIIDIPTGMEFSSYEEYKEWFAETYYVYPDTKYVLRFYGSDEPLIDYDDGVIGNWQDLKIEFYTDTKDIFVNGNKAINAFGQAYKAISDKNGNDITETYMPVTAPTWTAPTVFSGRCTIVNGGYAQTGKLVRVRMRLTSEVTRAMTTLVSYQMLEDLPAAAGVTVLNCIDHTSGEMIPCYVNTSGWLQFRLGKVGITQGDDIYVSGEYFAS